MSDSETLFREKLPKFTDAQAAELCHQHGQIVSMDGREAPLDTFLVMFMSEKDLGVGPLVLDPLVARRLCKLLLDHGYGPSEEHKS